MKLRRGGRTLGGSLSWDQPQALAAFSRESPFNGMAVPEDVKVSRQVLAEPEPGLTDRTWVTLADGTPLVTAIRRGKGIIILFHVTADTRWSDLPLSGTFVDMLKRIVAIAGSTTVTEADASKRSVREMVTPNRLLDGFGAFGPPPSTARPVPADYYGRATSDHPPGFYGPPEGLLAVNVLTPTDRLAPLDFGPLGARVEPFRIGEPQDLRAPILLTALVLLMIDALVVFWLSGGISRLMRWRRHATATLLLAGLFTGLTFDPQAVAQQPSQDQLLQQELQRRAQERAQELRPQIQLTPRIRSGPNQPAVRRDQKDQNPDFAMKATLDTRLAYVITGNAEVDLISKSGLRGLTLFLAQRTALEAGEPIGVDISRDELSFFPLIYWPIAPGAQRPSPAALARIDAYMKRGGTVLFDTRDAIMAPPGQGGENRSPGMLALRQILSSLDIPELEPVQRSHVLTKTFFLLRDFPGRFNSGQLWVEATPSENEDDETKNRPARAGDGVSSVLITSNDLGRCMGDAARRAT